MDDGDAAPGKAKSALVIAAEACDRTAPTLAGFLRKENSAQKFQRRYFEILGDRYWVYSKGADSPILCAMDLWRASAPALLPPAPGEPADSCDVFAITWDRYRLFKAASHADAARWVDAIARVQAGRPRGAAATPGDRPAFTTPGGALDAASSPAGGGEEWPPRRREGGGGAVDGRAAAARGSGAAAGLCACCVIA